MRITKNKLIIISVATVAVAILVYLISQSMYVRQVIFYAKLFTGHDSLSGLDDAQVYKIKYPKVLTKNGLRPEIENELYTGSRDRECKKDGSGNCVPSDNSYIGASLSVVKKEDRKDAEQYLLHLEAADQEFLKDLSVSETESVMRKQDIYRICYENININYEKFYEVSQEASDVQKYFHPEEFLVALQADNKVTTVDYNGIEESVKKEFGKSKEKCRAYLSENK